ncbi:MAG: HigA family addiction module antitoxin [bacterium]
MQMKNPPHPGKILKQECLEPLGLSITEAALKLGISRTTLSEIVNGKSGISSLMALKLAKAFNTTPEFWINMQSHYDLAQARKTANLDDVQVMYG